MVSLILAPKRKYHLICVCDYSVYIERSNILIVEYKKGIKLALDSTELGIDD